MGWMTAQDWFQCHTDTESQEESLQAVLAILEMGELYVRSQLPIHP